METPKTSGLQVFWRAALLYLLITAALFYTAATGDAGFSYALDLPYLQLALAQHIAHGTYGIHAGETTAPVASIVWPFLLAPFARCSFLQWVPLLLNGIAGIGVCALVAFCIDRYYRGGWQRMAGPTRWLFALLLVLAANLPALALVGMEHTLQVLVAGGCAVALAEMYFARKVPVFCLVCAAVAPAVRYEDLAFTLAVCLVCWFGGSRKSALVVAGLSVLPLLVFGLFLHAHGLPAVPAPVFTEGRLLPASVLREHTPGVGFVPAIVLVNLKAYAQVPQRWPIVLMFLLLCIQLWRVRAARLRRSVVACVILCLALLMMLGPYGYFYRLDVAYRFFAFLLLFAFLAECEWFGRWPALGTAVLAAVVYIPATFQVAGACWGTAHGQKQAQRFVQLYYRNNVLVTDPGWVAFDSRDRFYVMSAESVTRLRAEEMRHELQARGVNLALLSPRIAVDLPADWKRVAVLCRYGDGFNCTTIFRSAAVREQSVLDQLRAFAEKAPSGTWISYEDGSRSDVP